MRCWAISCYPNIVSKTGSKWIQVHFARITVLQNWKSWLCASTKFASRFCASTKFESRFCASTKWSYWRKVIFVLAHFCNQDFVLAQNFDSRFCASTKSKNHDFYTIFNKGELSPIFFRDFGKFKWFLMISVVCNIGKTQDLCNEFHFSQSKKTTKVFFFVWSSDRLHSESPFPSHPCLLKCAPSTVGAKLHSISTCNKPRRCAKKLPQLQLSLSTLKLTV